MKRDELLTVRVEPKIKEKLKALEKSKIETRSNIIREALIKYIEKETEMEEIKKSIAERFAAGLISFEEIVRILGYEEARKVAFFTEMVKESFEEGLK